MLYSQTLANMIYMKKHSLKLIKAPGSEPDFNKNIHFEISNSLHCFNHYVHIRIWGKKKKKKKNIFSLELFVFGTNLLVSVMVKGLFEHIHLSIVKHGYVLDLWTPVAGVCAIL